MSDDRLRHKLELQSLQIEEVFTRRRAPAHVAGGTIRPGSISFELQTHMQAGKEWLRGLREDLKASLRAPDVSLHVGEGQVRVDVTQVDQHPVDLLDVLSALGELSPLTAVLGLSDEYRPVLLSLASPDVSHALISGLPGSGKTSLLKSISLSLALASRQSQAQVVAIAANGGAKHQPELLAPLTYLPHALLPVICETDEAAEILRYLAEEMKYRLQQGVRRPLIVVLIDHVVTLIQHGGERITGPLTTLLQRGDEAGLRLILTTERPASALLSTVIRSSLPLRIVGKMATEADAYAAAGTTGSQAEFTTGGGDFVAVFHDSVVPFQAAYVGDYDFHLCLDRLQRQRAPALLAQVAATRPSHHQDEKVGERAFVLALDGRPAILGGDNGAGLESDEQEF
jgi:DNA segregation ATPase FtsK/SpoIIIE-like protein